MAINTGANPPDFDTLAGQVRVLVGDTDPDPLDPAQPGLGEYAWYSDDELEALGALHGNNAKRVAIWVLSIVPLNMAMLLRKWTSEDLQIDGPAIIKGMEATLKRLSAEVDAEDALVRSEDTYFEVFAPGHAPRFLPPGAIPPSLWY